MQAFFRKGMPHLRLHPIVYVNVAVQLILSFLGTEDLDNCLLAIADWRDLVVSQRRKQTRRLLAVAMEWVKLNSNVAVLAGSMALYEFQRKTGEPQWLPNDADVFILPLHRVITLTVPPVAGHGRNEVVEFKGDTATHSRRIFYEFGQIQLVNVAYLPSSPYITGPITRETMMGALLNGFDHSACMVAMQADGSFWFGPRFNADKPTFYKWRINGQRMGDERTRLRMEDRLKKYTARGLAPCHVIETDYEERTDYRRHPLQPGALSIEAWMQDYQFIFATWNF